MLLLVATGEGLAIAVLLSQRRAVALALGELQHEVRAVLRVAEQEEDLPPSSAPARPIGFRA